MKVFVTGVSGQLGYDVMHELLRRSHQAIGSGRQECSEFDNYITADLTDQKKISDILNAVKPDAVIHCAGWTNVDGAEDEKNQSAAMRVNGEATTNIAKICKDLDCKLLFVSTDYVFNGEGNKPWSTDDDCSPLNVYGLSKREGEKAVAGQLEKYFIVRTSWLYGKNGKNFVKTMLSLAERGYRSVRVVDDQIGTPTYTVDLARLLVDMIESEKYGYYHASNEGGYISWADFAEEIFRLSKDEVTVNHVTTAEYGLSKAKRPFNSRLDKTELSKNGFSLLPDWKDALCRYLQTKDE